MDLLSVGILHGPDLSVDELAQRGAQLDQLLGDVQQGHRGLLSGSPMELITYRSVGYTERRRSARPLAQQEKGSCPSRRAPFDPRLPLGSDPMLADRDHVAIW